MIYNKSNLNCKTFFEEFRTNTEMHIWDSVTCTPLRIFADGRTQNIILVFCTVISQLLVNFIPDHATKHRHFIVTLERLSIYFLNMRNFRHYQYSRLPLRICSSYCSFDLIKATKVVNQSKLSYKEYLFFLLTPNTFI